MSNYRTTLQTILKLPAWLGEKTLGLTHRASHFRDGILSRKSLIIALVILVLLGPSAYLLSRRPKAAEAAGSAIQFSPETGSP